MSKRILTILFPFTKPSTVSVVVAVIIVAAGIALIKNKPVFLGYLALGYIVIIIMGNLYGSNNRQN